MSDTDQIVTRARGFASNVATRGLLAELRVVAHEPGLEPRVARDAILDVLGARYPTINAALGVWVENGAAETQADVALRVAAELGLDQNGEQQ